MKIKVAAASADNREVTVVLVLYPTHHSEYLILIFSIAIQYYIQYLWMLLYTKTIIHPSCNGKVKIQSLRYTLSFQLRIGSLFQALEIN